VYPYLLPQIASLFTGHLPGVAAFRAGYEPFVAQLARLVESATGAAP
jgi:hypothetical protein